MKPNTILNSLLPHLKALGVIFIACALYFLPELKGGVIESHDRISYIGASKELKDYEAKGEQIFWTSRVFSGMPLFQISTSKTWNLINYFNIYRDAVPFSMGLSLSLMVGFYFALVFLQIPVSIATITAIVFGFSTWFLLSIEAAHSSKMYAISFVAPFIASLITFYHGRILFGGMLTAITLCLMIAANHFQIVYYTIYFTAAVLLLFFIESLLNKSLATYIKNSFVLLAFAILGVLPNAAILMSTYDYGKETIRGGKSELTQSQQSETEGLSFDYAMSWSYGKAESFNLLIPGIMAGGYSPNEDSKTVAALVSKGVPKQSAIQYAKGLPMYYGDQPFTSGPTYIGATILFLFLLMFFIEKKNIKWLLLGVFILSLLFAWGRHFEAWNTFFFNTVPMFNKFRTPSMWLTLAIISAFAGAALAIQNLMNKSFDKAATLKGIYIASGILGAICVAFYIAGESIIENFSGSYDEQLQKNGFPVDAMIKDRVAFMQSDALRSLAFILLSATVAWAWVNEKLNKDLFLVGAFGLLFVLDIVPVGLRYVNSEDFKESYGKPLAVKPNRATATILQDTDIHYRVFNAAGNPFNDNDISYFHKSVGGYSAVKLYRYQDLIEYHLSKGNMAVFNMLNTKYFIQGKPGEEVAQQNPNACGAVWFVSKVNMVANADAEMAAMNEFEPLEEAIVDERYKGYLSNTTFNKNGTIQLSSFHPERMVYTTDSNDEQFAVFSEIWYKGNEDWKAYINGKEAEFIRVNYLLRGMKIPAGKNEIVFEFTPHVFHLGNKISLASSVLILLMAAFLLYRKNKATATAA